MKNSDRSGWTPEGAAEQDAPSAKPVPDPTADSSSLFDLARRVVSEGQAYAATEMERQRIRAIILSRAARDTALLALSAIFLLFGAMTALVVACVWMLAPLVGVAGALAITIAGAMLIVIGLLLAARSRMQTAVRVAFGGKDEA